MKTIVALVDFSDLTFKVLKQAHAQARAFDSEVVIMHVPPKKPCKGDKDCRGGDKYAQD